MRHLKEYQHHIEKTTGVSYCGEPLWGFHFVNAEHAFATLENRDRSLPCPGCWRHIGRGEMDTAPRADKSPLQLVRKLSDIIHSGWPSGDAELRVRIRALWRWYSGEPVGESTDLLEHTTGDMSLHPIPKAIHVSPKMKPELDAGALKVNFGLPGMDAAGALPVYVNDSIATWAIEYSDEKLLLHSPTKEDPLRCVVANIPKLKFKP